VLRLQSIESKKNKKEGASCSLRIIFDSNQDEILSWESKVTEQYNNWEGNQI
jgi:hypothetical protein